MNLYMRAPGEEERQVISKDNFKSVLIDHMWDVAIKDSGCPEVNKWNELKDQRDHMAAAEYYNEIDIFGDGSILEINEDGTWFTVDGGTGHEGKLKAVKHWFVTVFNEYFKLIAEFPNQPTA